MNLKSVGVAVALAIGVFGGTALAAEMVSSVIGSDGTINGCYAQKTGALRVVESGQACGRGELAIQWNQKGPKGDTGAAGAPGAPGPKGDTGPPGLPGQTIGSLTGVPCATGLPDILDGSIVPATLLHGVMSLTCVSNVPVLTVSLQPLAYNCFNTGFVWGCAFAYGSAEEVDATGTPVDGGFACSEQLAGWPYSGYPAVCKTLRFAVGTTVRLRTSAPSGYVSNWVTGCDSVDANICTVTIKAGPQYVQANAGVAAG
jgi:hypothetical protein